MNILLIFIHEDKNNESFIDNLHIKEVKVFVFYDFSYQLFYYVFIAFFIILPHSLF